MAWRRELSLSFLGNLKKNHTRNTSAHTAWGIAAPSTPWPTTFQVIQKTINQSKHLLMAFLVPLTRLKKKKFTWHPQPPCKPPLFLALFRETGWSPVRFRWGWACRCPPAPPWWSGRCLRWSSAWWCCHPCEPESCWWHQSIVNQP